MKHRDAGEQRPASDEEQSEIFLTAKPPSYELSVCAPGSESALLFALTRRRLVQANDVGYATMAHMVNMREFVSENGSDPKTLAAMRVNSIDEFELGFTMSLFTRLSKTAQAELLKLQLLRIPYGHFSDRAHRLAERYGIEVAMRAAEIVLSQVVNPAILAEEGVVLPVPEMWNLDRNQTWEFYCEKLFDIGGGAMPTPARMVTFDGNKTLKIESSNSGLMLDRNGLSNVSNLDSAFHHDPGALSFASKALLERVDEELKRRRLSLKTQGFMTGDAIEFIEALQRPSRVDWAQRLRGACGRFESRRRKINKHRPSRRGWPLEAPGGRVVDYYKGRIRKKDTLVLFVVDTSGSMGARELRCVESELRSIANRALVMVLQADAGVINEPEVFRPQTQLREFRGRGGTLFEPALRYAETMTPRPDLVIYYTDGLEFTLNFQPDFPVLWLLTSGGRDEDEFRETVGFGDVVKIDVDETS